MSIIWSSEGALLWMLSNCSFSPPGGRADPFSCGSLFSPKRNRGGRTLHRGQTREAVTGAGNVPIHRGRGYQASGQGRKLTHGSFACFDSCRLWYTNWTLSGHFLDGQASEEQTSGRSWGSCAQCKWTPQNYRGCNQRVFLKWWCKCIFLCTISLPWRSVYVILP